MYEGDELLYFAFIQNRFNVFDPFGFHQSCSLCSIWYQFLQQGDNPQRFLVYRPLYKGEEKVLYCLKL